MNKVTSVPSSSSSVVNAVRPERDLAANWEVDLAKELDHYLLKICPVTITDGDEVNFSEAALVIQNSVQVYSRKVEYLYTFVLRTIEFLSQSSNCEASSANFSAYSDSFYTQTSNFGSMATREDTTSPNSSNKKDPVLVFNMSYTIDVEGNSTLDSTTEKDVNLNHFVKPPANLVVLEGDIYGDASELGSYQLSTTYMYKILCCWTNLMLLQ
ncbi:hypothetical protein L6164_025421 [Bauhinia variegata]|uniref:Uncharacterized protein n=1 Tax=Bauhinia variegata TaxID=167791 RepID=A0ACB9M0G3_BAUVA|nr:hypothetical protein L6164_025421 [Bauhinia variegata]